MADLTASSAQVKQWGKYQLTNEAAWDGAIYYSALDSILQRPAVVVEIPIPADTPLAWKQDRIDRFLRDVRVLAKIDHPNIVEVYDAGFQGDSFFVASERLEGETLRQTLDRVGRMTEARAVEITESVLWALSYAHGNGVLHGDLRPDDIYLLANEDIKVGDFGIARLKAEPPVSSYTSPEQAQGGEAVACSDLFSLGVILYEMLTGTNPFVADTAPEIVEAILSKQPERAALMSDKIWAILSKALEKKPENRFASAMDFSDALEPGKFDDAAIVEVPLIPTFQAKTVVPPPPLLRGPNRPIFSSPDPVGASPQWSRPYRNPFSGVVFIGMASLVLLFGFTVLKFLGNLRFEPAPIPYVPSPNPPPFRYQRGGIPMGAPNASEPQGWFEENGPIPGLHILMPSVPHFNSHEIGNHMVTRFSSALNGDFFTIGVQGLPKGGSPDLKGFATGLASDPWNNSRKLVSGPISINSKREGEMVSYSGSYNFAKRVGSIEAFTYGERYVYFEYETSEHGNLHSAAAKKFFSSIKLD